MAHSHSIKEYPGQIAGVVALSAALGAGLGLLFAPRKGTATRADLRRRADKLNKKAQRSTSSAIDKVKHASARINTSTLKAKTPAKSASTPRRSTATPRASAPQAGRRSATRNTSRQKDLTDQIRRQGEP